MNLAASAPSWLLAILCLLLCLAAAEDAWRLKISNLTSVAVAVGAVVAAAWQGIELSAWQNLAVFAAILVLGTAAFSAGLLGGGDVKLFAATGLWFDLRSAIWFVACVFLAGGILGLIYLIARMMRGGGVRKRGATRVPYGLAIAAGGLLLIAVQSGWLGSQRDRQPLPPGFSGDARTR